MYSQDRYLENILRLISTFALTGLNIFLDISNLHFWLVQVKSCICRISCRIYTETNFTTLSSDIFQRKSIYGCEANFIIVDC